jgi:hypothetical protein
MKKFVIAFATLAAISSGAFAAQGNDDNNDADSRLGFDTSSEVSSDVRGLTGSGTVQGRKSVITNYGTTMDPAEVRRLDEKN